MGATVDTKNAINVKTSNPVNQNDGADVIYITAAGYRRYPFKCATPDSDLGWDEPIWGSDLTRSTDFVLTNILDVDYGLVARVEISYAYMNIADYKVLCKISKERVCYVTYFNRETATWVTDQEFAFTSQSLKQLYAFGSSYFGARDISIALVATNRDRTENKIGKLFTVAWKLDSGTSGSIMDLAQRDSDGNPIKDENGNTKYNNPKEIQWGGACSMPTSNGFSKSGYTFAGWYLSGNTNSYYGAKMAVTVWGDMTFYPRWNKN